MKLETFFEKFELFADAPGAVAKMREIILDNAVNGNLSAPRSSDTWRSVKLGDLIAKGLKSIDPNSFPTQTFELWSVPSFESGEPEIVTGSSIGSTKRSIPDGSILLGKINPHLNRVWRVSRRTKHPLIASPEWIVVIPTEDWDSNYLARILASPSFNRKICATAQGMGSLTRANTRMAALIELKHPPLAEQKRIVAKVDELMALCDRLETQQKERETRHTALVRASLARFTEAPTPANLQFLFHPSCEVSPADLRKTILTLAVQGKLVPQDPNDEPAANLVSQIADEKRRLVAAKIIRGKDEAAPIADSQLPFEVPYGWEWTRLSSITRRIHYGYTASAKPELEDVRLLRITDIQNNSVDWMSVPGCEIPKDDIPQFQLERGDILVARTGGTVGKTYLVQDVPVVAVFASYLIRIQGGTALFDRYLKLFLESPLYWAQLEEGARGAAQPNVNSQTLGNMLVPVPPLAEQRRIVTKVEQLMALVDELEQQLAASRATAEKLLTALVAELVNGKKNHAPAEV